MLDINFIRDNAEKVKKATKAKNISPSIVGRLLKVDAERRKILGEVEAMRAKRNKFTKDDITEGKKLKVELNEKEDSLKVVEKDFSELIVQIPNPPAEDVKTGKDESENEILRKEGTPKKLDFNIKDHLTLGQDLGIINTEAASKVSGSRFGYLVGDGARLEFALIQYAMEVLSKAGFTPIVPPVLMKVPVFKKLGYSEHLGNENYYQVEAGKEEEGYYLIGTSEHSVVPYFMDQTLDAKDLPKRFVSFSTCFRREAGSYGKDTRGILRVHQFDKVEMVSFTKPKDSDAEHEFLLSLEEKLLKSLDIPYQVVKMCSGDLGAPAARKYDLEAWIPSEKKYRELTSTSSCTDFQSRRLNIKYRDGQETGFVHTLNGTAFAIGRTIIAILENYQQKDGSVLIPKVLQKWVGKEYIR